MQYDKLVEMNLISSCIDENDMISVLNNKAFEHRVLNFYTETCGQYDQDVGCSLIMNNVRNKISPIFVGLQWDLLDHVGTMHEEIVRPLYFTCCYEGKERESLPAVWRRVLRGTSKILNLRSLIANENKQIKASASVICQRIYEYLFMERVLCEVYWLLKKVRVDKWLNSN